MRYLVRNAEGEELVVPSLRDLRDLYVHGFLADDDLVRSERASQWVRAGALPALHGIRETRRDPRRILGLLVAAGLVAALVAAFVAVWLGR